MQKDDLRALVEHVRREQRRFDANHLEQRGTCSADCDCHDGLGCKAVRLIAAEIREGQ